MLASKSCVILFSLLILNITLKSTQARPSDIEPREYDDRNGLIAEEELGENILTADDDDAVGDEAEAPGGAFVDEGLDDPEDEDGEEDVVEEMGEPEDEVNLVDEGPGGDEEGGNEEEVLVEEEDGDDKVNEGDDDDDDDNIGREDVIPARSSYPWIEKLREYFRKLRDYTGM